MSIAARSPSQQGPAPKTVGTLSYLRLIRGTRAVALPSTGRLVLMVIASHINNRTLEASLYAATIAREAALSRRAVVGWIGWLEDAGFILRDEDWGRGVPGRRPTSFQIIDKTLKDLQEPIRDRGERPGNDGGDEDEDEEIPCPF